MAGMHNMLLGLQAGTGGGGGGGIISTVDMVDPFGDGSGKFLFKFNGDTTDAGGTYTTTPTSITYSTGVFGQAAVFTGNDSYISTNFKMPALSSYTISLWAKVSTALRGEHVLFADSDSAGQNLAGRAFIALYGTKFYANMGNGTAYWYDTSSCDLTDIFNGNFHNIVLVVQGTTQKLYVDNVLRYTYTSTVTAGAAGAYNYVIGKAGQYNGVYFNGSVDQLRFINRALTAAEVAVLYIETKAA